MLPYLPNAKCHRNTTPPPKGQSWNFTRHMKQTMTALCQPANKPINGQNAPGPSFHSYLSEFIMRKSVTLTFSMATWYKDPTPRKRPWCWERLKAGEEGDRGIRWSGGIINSRDTSLSKLQDIVQNREAWQATVHGITKSLTRLSDWTPSYNYRLQLKFTIKNLNLNADKNH